MPFMRVLYPRRGTSSLVLGVITFVDSVEFTPGVSVSVFIPTVLERFGVKFIIVAHVREELFLVSEDVNRHLVVVVIFENLEEFGFH